jgi:hypothetical protein
MYVNTGDPPVLLEMQGLAEIQRSWRWLVDCCAGK